MRVHVSVCTCTGMLIWMFSKKKKKNLLIHLVLLIVYGTVPALCCVLSASHSSDFIFFLELIVAVDVADPPTCCHESDVYIDICE